MKIPEGCFTPEMSPDQPVNEVEICVVACRRSGHHAVMNWLAEQFPGTPFLVNDCRIGENPFTQNRKRFEREGREREAKAYRQEESGRHSRKELLICNFEDCDLRDVFAPAEMARRERAFGPSRVRHHVLILRDHCNLFASRIKRVRVGSHVQPRERLEYALHARRLYVQHARECLDETRYINDRKVVILYNKWFRDEQYRREISARLNGSYREETLGQVPTHGKGSSFDGLAYENRAREMEVLDRWRAFSGNFFFAAVVGNKQMCLCTSRLFPEIDFPTPSLFSRGVGWIAYGVFLGMDLLVRVLRRLRLFP